MKSVFVFPFRLLAFWLLFFVVFRVWFVVWFRGEWSQQEPLSAWQSLWHALPLDLSTAAYLMLVPILLWFVGLAVGRHSYPVLGKVILWLHVFLVGIAVLIFGANIFIYEEWRTLLNNRAVEYLSTPRAMLDSMSLLFKIASVGLYAAFVWLMWRVYKLIVGTGVYPAQTSRRGLWALPVLSGLLLLAVRGGLGVIPINESAVYYSPHLFDNHAATNAAWNLIHSLIETRSRENHYRFMDEAAAESRVQQLLRSERADTNFVNGLFEKSVDLRRLNIVFIIMESHTAQVVEELDGEPGVCPNLSRLIREGILFEGIYSSGYRTDQGLVSVLAGYPAQPDQSIVLLSDKAEKLTSIPKILHGQGYATAFFYGGELTFANIGMWLTGQRFEKIFSEKDFSRAEKTQRWGVDDHVLLQRAAVEISKLKEPFFATAMTLSLHPPFDVPYQSKWQGQTEPERFLNSAAFADYAIGEFFKTVEQQPWYANTLFVLVADHGATNPGQFGLDNPAARHVPLIFFGKPLQTRNFRIGALGNHHDIPATLMEALQLPDTSFKWSRGLWEPKATARDSSTQIGFAFYTNESGMGWATAAGKGSCQFGNGIWRIWEGQLDSASRVDARAYLQVLYDDFLEK